MSLLAALGLKPRHASAASVADAMTADSPTAAQKGPAVDKHQAAFDDAKAAVLRLLDELNKHPQKARIATPIADIVAKVAAADAHAAKKEWSEALKRLAEAKPIHTRARKLAEDWATYMRQRGSAQALGYSFDSAANALRVITDNVISAADALATSTTPPNFAAAKKQLDDGITKSLKPTLDDLIKSNKSHLATLAKTSAASQAFAKADIDEGKARNGDARKQMAAGEWTLCRNNALSALRVLGPAVRMVERRGPYDVARAATMAALAQLEASAVLKDRAPSLKARLAQADQLASHGVRKFEDGAAILSDVSKRAGLWKKLEGEVDTATKARAAAQADLAMLDKHVAAAKVATQREAVRKQLALAAALVPSLDLAPDPTASWAHLSATSVRCRDDAAAAKKLADGFGASSAAQAAAARPGDAAGLKAALDKLVADGNLAAKADGADAAAAEFKKFDEHGGAAAAALKGSDTAKAAKALSDAATALEAAKRIQSAHGQFKAELGATEAALKGLQASPRAAQLRPRTDPIAAALGQAKAKDTAHDGAAALALLRQANGLLGEARKADAERARFDADSAAATKLVTKAKGPAEKAALEKMVADAAKLADAMKFGDAGKLLKQVLVRIDKVELDAKIAANPGDPKIAKLANKMVENGGAATVDGMIAALPGGNDTRLVNALAEGRYGMTFKSGAALPGGNQVKAMQAVCAMFATVPGDVRKNSSISGVTHNDKAGTARRPGVSGAHDFDDASITLGGRPGTGNQALGGALVAADPRTRRPVKQLPASIDADCQPKDATPVELLAFTAAHEVGHAVDDKLGFMATHGPKDAYGGWVRFGSSVQPLADIIGADSRFKAFYKTPEQRRYVLDTLMSKPAMAPAAGRGSAEASALAAFNGWFATATSPGVYEREGDSASLKIGKHIYHEAYTRDWVGYLAEARSKGLTGYQFRAPAEWFAELYAGFRSGKLKDSHPSMSWLKKL